MRSLLASVLCTLFILSVARADVPPVAHDLLDPQMLADRALRLLDPSHTGAVPGPSRATCGTATLMAVRSGWNDLPEKTRGRLALLLQQQGRPTTQAVTVSPSGRFRIHYDTSGLHAVALTDLNGNGVPDYVEEVGTTADSAWSLQIDGFGFHPPPSDGTVGGGAGQYDIYIQELSRSSAYGFTYPETTTTPTTTSYLEVDNNFTDKIYTSKGNDGLHVTIAHEFFHAIQFGYYSLFDAQWWQEVTAVWMEDAAYPEVNDYYQYLPSFFDSPTVSLDRFLLFGDLHPFGSAVFIHNLHALFGITAMRAGWERLAAQKAWDIQFINDALPGGFDQVFPRFVIWDYFTKTRALPGYYREASAYPLVKTRSMLMKAGTALADSGRVDHLGADYLQFKPGGQAGGLSITLTLASRARWKVSVLLIQAGGVQIMESDGRQIRVPAWGQYDEIVVIPICLSLAESGFTYRITAEVRSDILKPARAVGDFNVDGSVDFTDFFAFAEAYGKGAASAGFNPGCDLNGDGAVNLDDFFIFAVHFGETSG
ncbi:MAG: hypothetical protein EXS64_11880 [Candidatus Latescibacteria bacterium]|nr:hypothetical protein [Candidatus Latescibacterota bacterium]